MKTNLINILTLGAIATTGIAIAETDKQSLSSKIQIENSVSQSPAEMTATRCLICHGDTLAGQARLAPPFMMVKMHYQSLDEEAFIKTVSSWVKEPNSHKSKMPGAINHFGLMPALPYPEADITAIAKYVYDTDFPMPGGGKGMGRGQGGMGCGSCKTDATNEVEGCGKGCETSEGNAPKAKGPDRSSCEADKGDKQESEIKTTDTPKWPIPAPMMNHLKNLEKDITKFEDNASTNHARLAKRIEKHISKLISSCTMDGEGHNALHIWLVSFRGLAQQHSESTDPAVQKGLVHELRGTFKSFHAQFEPAPKP